MLVISLFTTINFYSTVYPIRHISEWYLIVASISRCYFYKKPDERLNHPKCFVLHGLDVQQWRICPWTVRHWRLIYNSFFVPLPQPEAKDFIVSPENWKSTGTIFTQSRRDVCTVKTISCWLLNKRHSTQISWSTSRGVEAETKISGYVQINATPRLRKPLWCVHSNG